MRAPAFRLYLISDRQQTAGRPLLDVIEAALRGGVDAVQLREKDLPAAELFALAGALRDRCVRHGARLLINDRLDVAMAVGADGVHLPADSFAPAQARQVLGTRALIGVSTHGMAAARAAECQGADFITCGPIFDTASKRAFGPPLGLEALDRVAHAVGIPVFAIGGVQSHRVAAVRARGAQGVAVISGILAAEDACAAARLFHTAITDSLPAGTQS